MAFIALPSGLNGTPLHRRTYGSAITETYEEAEKWAQEYIKRRKERLDELRMKQRDTHNKRRVKRASESFARLHSVIIYEDVGRVVVE